MRLFGVASRLLVGAQRLGGNPPGERRDPLRLLAIGPELLVEQQRVEPAETRFKGGLPVGLPEETRVPQPRRDDALGVARDGALVVGLGVDDGEERVLQPSVLSLDRKVVLMMNQRRRQHLIRQLEELEREGAADHRRVLDEIGHLVEEPGLGAGDAADAALQALCLRVELACNLVVALAALEDHEVLEQPRAVFVEGPDLDGPPRASARRQEAVSVGHRARRDLLHLTRLGRRGTGDRERHDAAAIDEQNPADRPAEQQLAPAVLELRIPVHQFRERQAAQRSAEHVREHVDRRLAPLLLSIGQVGALGGFDALERGDVDALLGREAARGRRRRAVSAEARRNRRAVDQILEIGLPLGETGDPDRQPPRRAVGFGRRLRRQAVRAQLGEDDLANLVRQAGQPAGRQLLASDFEQQFPIEHLRDRLSRRLVDVLPGDADRQLADAQDVGRSLGDADAVARVENVEQVRALQAVLERGPDQARLRAAPRPIA